MQQDAWPSYELDLDDRRHQSDTLKQTVEEMKTNVSSLVIALGLAAVVVAGMATTLPAKAQPAQEIELNDTEIMAALVVAIDKQDRALTLLGSQGDVVTFEVGQRVTGFDEIEVGDYFKVEYYRSVALYLGGQGTQPEADAGLIIARTPKGEQAVGAIDVSAQVRHIDGSKRLVTLEGHDGHSVTVGVDKRLQGFDTLRVGDLIHTRYTKAVAVSLEAAVPDDPASAMTLLFVQNAQGMSYDRGANTLILDHPSPTVIFFADRPYRLAGHVPLPAFLELWSEGANSFKQDPPNANLSTIDGGDVSSAVIEIANPQFSNDRLTYEVVKVLEGDLSSLAGESSLFIDGLLKGAAGGAAGGTIVGAIAGDSKKGRRWGAGVGAVGGAIAKDKKQQAAAQAQAQSQAELTTRVINVPNANGSFTPVTLNLVQNGWQGPRGEIYPTLPDVSQLQEAYGL